MHFTEEKVSKDRCFPTATSSLHSVSLDLTNGELVRLSKKELFEKLFAAYKAKFPQKQPNREKFQKLFDSDPMHAWALRDIFEDRKWESPQALMEAYAEVYPVAHRDARSSLNCGLAYSLDRFKEPPGLNEDQKYIRENIGNGTLMAHERMRGACGIALPEETFESLEAKLILGNRVRVEQDLNGARLVLSEKFAGETRDVDMERLSQSHYCLDVNALFVFQKMQEIFDREVRQGNKVPVTVELLEAVEGTVGETVGEHSIPHRFVVLCSKFEYARGEHFQRAKEIANNMGLDSLVAAVEVPAVIKTEQMGEKGTLWWSADNMGEADKWVKGLSAKGCRIVKVDPEDDRSVVHVVFELPKDRAKEILGYEPAEEEWVDQEDDDSGPRP